MIITRNPRGNMLTIMALTMAMFVSLAMFGFTFDSALFHHCRSQNQADALALDLSARINEGDRVGQINELEICSRELMYLSHKDLQQCSEEQFQFLTPLCLDLLNEAQKGHLMVERERRNQVRVVTQSIQDMAVQHNGDANKGVVLALPWLEIGKLRVEQVDAGFIANIESNVAALPAIRELYDYDKRKGFIDKSSGLYKGNINATLTNMEGTLSFRLASLPACVSNTCAPARNTNPEVFVSTGTLIDHEQKTIGELEQIPSAVQVRCSMSTAFLVRQKLKTTIALISSGSTNGALAESVEPLGK